MEEPPAWIPSVHFLAGAQNGPSVQACRGGPQVLRVFAREEAPHRLAKATCHRLKIGSNRLGPGKVWVPVWDLWGLTKV